MGLLQDRNRRGGGGTTERIAAIVAADGCSLVCAHLYIFDVHFFGSLCEDVCCGAVSWSDSSASLAAAAVLSANTARPDFPVFVDEQC